MPLLSPTVRSLRSSDRAAVESVLHAAGVFRDDEIRTALAVFDAADQDFDYHRLGGFLGDKLLGYVCYGPTPMTEATWHLYWIAVTAEAQRSGVGRALLEAVFAACQSAGARLLTLEASGAPPSSTARAFYTALGFCEEARIRHFYRPDDDVVHFVRRFTS